MSQQRFFIPDDHFQAEWVLIPLEVEEQIKRVLRLKDGDQVIMLNSHGMEYRVQLEQDPAGDFSGKILSRKQNTAEPQVQLTLYIALTQREKFEWILQKGTETGVVTFQPFICERSLVQDGGTVGKKLARWEKILREAAEQCGRGRVPLLHPPLDLKEAVKSATDQHALVLAAWEDENRADLAEVLEDFPADGSLGLFVGPEGGFSAVEIESMRLSGLRTFTLGPRILRMETAAILAPALVLYRLGEMNRQAN